MKPSPLQFKRRQIAIGLIVAACAVAGACTKQEPKRKVNAMPNYSQNVGNLDTFGTVRTSNRAVIDSGAKSGSSGGH